MVDLKDVAAKADVERGKKQSPYTGNSINKGLPATAIDMELFKQTISDAEYGGVKFGVVSYKIQSGRDVDVTTLYKGSPTTIGGSGSSGERASLALEVAQTIADVSALPRELRANALANLAGGVAAIAFQPTGKPHIDSTYGTPKGDYNYWANVASSNLLPIEKHPLVDDKGALPIKIVLRAYFIDNAVTARRSSMDTGKQGRVSYMENRDRFLNLVNSPNPHLLQLPTYGAFPAVAGTVVTEYDNTKMGIEYIDVEFYKATNKIATLPSTKGNTILVGTRGIEAQQQVVADVTRMKEDLAWRLANTNGLLPYDRSVVMEEGVLGALASVADNIGTLTTGIIEAIDDKLATINKYNRKIAAISNEIDTLILAPARLSQSILDTYTTFTKAITSPIESYKYMKAALSVFLDDMEDVTYTTLDTLGLYTASIKIEHIGHTFNTMIQASANTQYVSSTDVLATRDSITELYNSTIAVLVRFPEFADMASATSSLYGSIIEYLITQQADLPNTTTIIVSENIPLLVTTYALYGTVDAEDDLAYRNTIINRLTPKMELEVVMV